MTRNLFFACALMAAAALATVRALDPGCEGSFCLGSGVKTGADQDRTRGSEMPSAGRELLGVTAQESAPAAALEIWPSTADTRSPGTEAEPLGEQDDAAGAPEREDPSGDWQDEQIASTRDANRNNSRLEAFDEDEEPKLSYKERKSQAAAAAKAAKEWESLAEAALKEPDDELRSAAINGVALRRNADAVAVLNEVAALDPAPDNRLQALQQLWYSAADGLDRDGGIESTLTAALDDPDETIAEIAVKALADLKALEESRLGN